MTLLRKWGIPLVNRSNILETLAELGIKPWTTAKPAVDLTDYMKESITEDQKAEAIRFAPKNQAIRLIQPNGKPFTGFRSTGKDWATVFTLLPGDLVPIIAEWKHGAECLSLVPPSGVLGKADEGSMEKAGMREFQEETGMKLKSIERIGSPNGIAVSTRQSTQRCHAFLGKVATLIAPEKSKLDETEHLKLVLVPLREWLAILDTICEEDCAFSVTYLALRKLNWFQL